MSRQTGTSTKLPDHTAVRPKGRNLRWLIIAVITFLVITGYLDRGTLSVAAPAIQEDLGFSNTTMGLILSSFVWAYAFMNLPAGWIADRFGAKAVLAITTLVWSIASVVIGTARTVFAFVGLRALLGMSEAPIFPASLKVTRSWFPTKERGVANGVYLAGTQVGLAISPPIATAFMLLYGWRWMFVIVGSLSFIALAAWLIVYKSPEKHKWLRREERTYIQANRDAGTSSDDTADSGHKVTIGEWSQLFRHRTTWAMIVGGFGLQYVFWFYITWLPTYLSKAQGMDVEQAGVFSALPYVAGAVAVFLGGRISDMLVQRGLAAPVARKYTIAGGAVLTAIALAVTAASSVAWMAVLMLTVGMFTYSLTTGPYWTLATDALTTPRLVASLGGIQNFGGFLGGAFAPILTGLVLDVTGEFLVALIIACTLLLISAFLYGAVLRKRLPL